LQTRPLRSVPIEMGGA